MGYKVQFEDGTHVEFDSQPSQQDIEDAHTQVSKGKVAETPLLKSGVPGSKQEQDPSLLEYLMGAPRKGFEQAKAAAPFRRGAELSAGATEAAANLASGGVALPAASVPAALQSLDQVSHGKAPHFLDNYENAVNSMTYQPKTETGRDIMEPIGEGINRYLLPVAPVLGGIPFHLPEGPLLARKMKEQAKKGPDPDAALNASSSSTVDSPSSAFEQMSKQLTPELTKTMADNAFGPDRMSNDGYQQPIPNAEPVNFNSTDPWAAQVQQLQAASERAVKEKNMDAWWQANMRLKAIEEMRDRAPQQPDRGPAAFNEMAQQLQAGQHDPVDFPGNNGMNTVVDSTHAQQLAALQKEIQQRQAQMEMDVKRQQGLDFNAQERARQEQADTGLQDHLRQQTGDRAMSSTADALLSPAERMQRQLARENAPREEGNPLYVTPDKQVLNTRPDDMAMEALRRQKEAGQNALDHGLQETRGEPLSLTQTDQLRAANEGPQARPQDILNTGMQRSLLDDAVEQHPLVQGLKDRITKQEEAITKLQMRQGKVAPSRLAREVKNLEGLEKALDRTRQNVERGLREQKRPVPFNFKKQGGAINSAILDHAFDKIKDLGDGLKLRALGSPRGVTIEAYKNGESVGHADFSPEYLDRQKSDERNLVAQHTAVSGEHRGQGIATEMYKFASELGNDISPSNLRSADGKAMWDGFDRKGATENGVIKSPGNKQRGALLIDPRDEGKGKYLADQPHLKLPSIVPEKLSPELAKEMIQKGEDVKQNFAQRAINLFTKGGLYQALKTGNPLIRYGVEKITDMDRSYRGDVQTYIHDRNTGLAPAARAMSKREGAQIWDLLNKADKEQRKITEEGLRAGGYNEKQIEFWKRHTEGMDAAFKAINEARKAAGKEPIDKRVAYAAMRSSGDFKRLVFSDPERTNVVGVIGSDYRLQLNKLQKTLEDKGFHVGQENYYAGTAMKRGSAVEKQLQRTLESLADKDPRVMDFMQTVDEIVRNEAYSMLNMKKHTLGKKGVFGMEGRKDWLSAEQNAKEGIQAQLDYMDGAFKWARLSQAAEDIRPLLTDEITTQKMPKAKEWVENYLNNALGYNPSEMGQGLSQAIASGMEHLGVGYSALRGAQSAARKTVNSIVLGLNPMFWLTNVVQPFRAMPGMMAYLVSKGLDKNFDLATGWSHLGKAAVVDFNSRYFPNKLSAVEKGALEYARTKHVYGSDLVEHSHRATKDFAYRAEKLSNVGAGAVESSTRKAMYLAFVDMLNKNGLSVPNGLYEAAHNLTDMTMNNYSRVDRPSVYNALGPLGDLAANLSSFKHNELSRIALFARQIAENKTARPLLVELATAVAFSGVLGLVGFDIAEALYKEISKLAGHPDSLKLRVIKLSEQMAKGMGAQKGDNSQYVLSHGGFSLLGVDMSNRLGLNNIFGNSAADVAFPGVGKLGDIGHAAIGMGYSDGELHAPSAMDTKRLVREASPGILQGVEDLSWFSKNGGKEAHNKKNLEMQLERTPTDIGWKLAGGTGIHESVVKDLRYEADNTTAGLQQRRMAIFGDIRDDLFTDHKVDPDKVKQYMANGGDPKSLLSQIEREATKQAIPRYKREMMQNAVAKSVSKLAASQKLNDAYENQR